jgi:hypothetical protein
MGVLIGLTGRKEVGKDTTYDRIQHLFHSFCSVERVGFADLIYRSASEALGVSIGDLHKWKSDPKVTIQVVREENGVVMEYHSLTVREFLQRYGYEAHRNIFGWDFWEKAVAAVLDSCQGILVVSDVRLQSEAELIQSHGGTIIKVHGDKEDHWDLHATEQSLPKGLVAYHIDNSIRDDDFVNLDAQVSYIVSQLLDEAWKGSKV